MIDPISTAALRYAQAAMPQAPLQQGQGQGLQSATGEAGSFGDTLKKALEEVSSVQDNAQDLIGAFIRGEPVELHQVMAATEEAGIALEMLVEIRNKFADAYRTVINMQS
jgi:flagellar hook-basal body complex protein FliE